MKKFKILHEIVFIDLDLKWKDEITKRQYNENILHGDDQPVMCQGIPENFIKKPEERYFRMVMEKDTFLPAKHKEYKV